jgi:uncharacterized protein YfaA (DUF2138 family)
MKFVLIENARKRWHRLWSMRLIILSAAGQMLVDVVPSLEDYIPRGTFIVLTVAAGVARLIQQEHKDDP